jgi:capsular polysaccharide biosynthesis protein
VLYILKKRIALLLVIVVAVSVLGVLYARSLEPKYTATELVFLRARNEAHDNITDNVSAMIAYIDTVVDFCDEGVVVDRANYHYNEYLKMKADGDSGIEKVEDYTRWSERHEFTYESQDIGIDYFKASNIKTTIGEKTITGNSPFLFTVSYTEDYQDVALDKVKILVHALKLESVEDNSNYDKKYFYGVEVEIIDEGTKGISTDISVKKTIALFVVFGVILGLAAVFLSYYLDNTIKSKEELERVAGVGVMSVIEYLGGGK